MLFASLAEQLPAPKNRLYRLRDDLVAAGHPVVDLVSGNPSGEGCVYPPDVFGAVLHDAAERARVYRPNPFGQETAREAIAAYYGVNGFSPNQILLTPGSSLAYWYCFKLLCEPGDEVLCPRPSYPLFDYIAKLSGVRLATYRLLESASWAIDLDYLEHRITTRTRALILISPHNPTGMVAGWETLVALAEIARRHRLPVVADEVFSEFLFEMDSLPRAAATDAPLVFTLNGFSKMFALPSVKVGWMVVSGERPLVDKALGALELMSDTFLPVNEIAQFAVPGIFTHGERFRDDLVRWVRNSRHAAMTALSGLAFVRPRGGFYMTLGVGRDEDAVAMELLEREGLLVHPGYFYDIDPNHVVFAFAHDPGRLHRHLSRLKPYVGAMDGSAERGSPAPRGHPLEKDRKNGVH